MGNGFAGAAGTGAGFVCMGLLGGTYTGAEAAWVVSAGAGFCSGFTGLGRMGAVGATADDAVAGFRSGGFTGAVRRVMGGVTTPGAEGGLGRAG